MLQQIVRQSLSFDVIYRKVSVHHERYEVIGVAVTFKNLSDASRRLEIGSSGRVDENGMKDI